MLLQKRWLCSSPDVLQSRPNKTLWFDVDKSIKVKKKRLYSEVILSFQPSVLPTGNYLTVVFTSRCTMGKPSVGAEKRADWEKSDPPSEQHEISQKKKKKVHHNPHRQSKGFSNLSQTSQIARLKKAMWVSQARCLKTLTKRKSETYLYTMALSILCTGASIIMDPFLSRYYEYCLIKLKFTHKDVGLIGRSCC